MNSSANCFFKESNLSPVLADVLMAEFILGLIGNSMVLWVFCFRISPWNTSTLYLFNVSLADFLLILCLPFRAEYFLLGKDWHFGDIPCRIMLFMISLNRTGSIFFLTAVVGNRYFMVVCPHHRINTMQTVPGGMVVTSLIWILIVSCTAYILTQSHLITGEIVNRTLCESFNLNWNGSALDVWHYGFFVIELLVPLVTILYFTSSIVNRLKRQKDTHGKIKNTIKSMTFVAFIFILCFLPSTVSAITVIISKTQKECDVFEISSLVFAASLALTYLNSVLNPLAIYVSSPVFQSILNVHNIYKCIKKSGTSRTETGVQHMT